MTNAQRRNVERDRMRARSVWSKLVKAEAEARALVDELRNDAADDAQEVRSSMMEVLWALAIAKDEARWSTRRIERYQTGTGPRAGRGPYTTERRQRWTLTG